jgi:hypothetical protein
MGIQTSVTACMGLQAVKKHSKQPPTRQRATEGEGWGRARGPGRAEPGAQGGARRARLDSTCFTLVQPIPGQPERSGRGGG